LPLFKNFLNVSFLLFSARAALSRYVADEAAARKQLAQVKGRLAKLERLEKGMLE